jgi:sec-independent protein translocase protein TatB
VFGIGPWELGVLLLLAVVLVGPDRMPGYARDAARLLKRLRVMADEATKDLREEMGPEFKDLDPRQLHPKTLIQKHIIEPAWADEEPSSSVTPVAPAQPPTTGGSPSPVQPPAMTTVDANAPARWDADAT